MQSGCQQVAVERVLYISLEAAAFGIDFEQAMDSFGLLPCCLAQALGRTPGLADDNWAHPYPRMLGGYPAGSIGDKYWCPVNRIDNVYGDRHLVCTCPPKGAYSPGMAHLPVNNIIL